MPRESRISATRPIFPTYLLPSFRFSFSRRHSVSSASSSWSSHPGESAVSSAVTTPNNSPPDREPIHDTKLAGGRRLSRAAPDTLRCMNCSTDVALASQIISKGFTGRYGRAFLVAPPLLPPADRAGGVDEKAKDAKDQGLLANIRVGRSEDRQLVTGWHVVADICCATCSRKLGWKYVDAKEQSQKYKVGKYILEVERVVTHRCWEDLDVPLGGCGDDMAAIEEVGSRSATAGGDDDDEEEEIVFDSEDEDECEDIFMGVWDAATVARRRSQTIAKRESMTATDA
ncbi:yippee family protein [Purpureocillium lavendulum]|uniref:Yippee family protein n=1 Tax=Purpureocillium lavendulum TaxID=1247861 RepID=A0AB34FZ77_9HYPO|nr:yippee family protein [Purpureocillium lavendulum]